MYGEKSLTWTGMGVGRHQRRPCKGEELSKDGWAGPGPKEVGMGKCFRWRNEHVERVWEETWVLQGLIGGWAGQ